MTTVSPLDLIAHLTGLHYRRTTYAGEYAGPCPWCGGEDRFHIWPERWHCLGASAGRAGCDRGGDTIQFLREYKGMGYREALDFLDGQAVPTPECGALRKAEPRSEPPTGAWTEQAGAWVKACVSQLHDCQPIPKALDWLTERRGLTEQTLLDAGIGYNPADQHVNGTAWGLPERRLWLPRGITIPWTIDGELWGVSVRRANGEPRYYWLPGGTRALYRADQVRAGAPVVLAEGELDALTIAQTCPDVVAVATGSTSGARQTRWIARLATASVVLVAFDADEAGDKAAHYWLDALPNARRWRPYWEDINRMAQDGVDVAAWIETGLRPANTKGASYKMNELDGLKRDAETALRAAYLAHEFQAGGQTLRLCWIQRVGRAETLTAQVTGAQRPVYEAALADLKRRAEAAFEAAQRALDLYNREAGLLAAYIDIGECDCAGCRECAEARERNVNGGGTET